MKTGTRCTERHMYQNAPNVEKRTRHDRSRCDDTRYRTKMTFYVSTVSPTFGAAIRTVHAPRFSGL